MDHVHSWLLVRGCVVTASMVVSPVAAHDHVVKWLAHGLFFSVTDGMEGRAARSRGGLGNVLLFAAFRFCRIGDIPELLGMVLSVLPGLRMSQRPNNPERLWRRQVCIRHAT